MNPIGFEWDKILSPLNDELVVTVGYEWAEIILCIGCIGELNGFVGPFPIINSLQYGEPNEEGSPNSKKDVMHYTFFTSQIGRI